MIPKKVVITGGPGTGKTSVIKLLSKKYPVMKESARLVLARNALFHGKNAVQAKGRAFQEAIWDLELKHYKESEKKRSKYVFFDRGFFDGFAYAKLSHLRGLNKRILQGRLIKYDYVFILNPLPKKYYLNDSARAESYFEGLKIHRLIERIYKKYGYHPIRVPFDTIPNRARFVINHLK